MSGGAWDYSQYRIQYIIDCIEEYIEKNTEKPEYYWGEWKGQVFEDETIEEFKKAIAFLQIAECYAQRADWLVSGDDGEDSFHRRLEKDFHELINNDKYGYVEKILKNENLSLPLQQEENN